MTGLQKAFSGSVVEIQAANFPRRVRSDAGTLRITLFGCIETPASQ
jgi:hypothetical protein